jgi:hypothetical protein
MAIVFLILSRVTDIQVMGVNAWYKPIKFSLSIGIYSWTMGWYSYYLGNGMNIKVFNWIVIVMLGFEIIYIAIQAGRGLLSHYNLSSPLYSGLYILMAFAATVVTLWTAYIGILFLQKDFPGLPDYYLWAIRLGIFLFVVFSLEGFVMGSRLSHTIGSQDGGPGLPFLNWSTRFGDPRVSHFIGMHALQVLPILSYYLLKNVKLTFAAGILYALLALFTLIQALQGKAFVKI